MANRCQVLDCPPIPFYSYTIQGELPVPTPPTPAAFYNESVVSATVCEEGDDPVFNGDLPGWITFDSENRQFVGAAGVWGGDSQDQANAIALAELQAFADANEDDVSCAGVSILFTWDNVQVTNGDGVASFTPAELASGNEAHGTAVIVDPAPGTAACFWIAEGSITWNSDDDVPANIHIDSSGVVIGDVSVLWVINIQVTSPAPVGLVSTDSGTLGLNSVTDIPFDLPDTGGADWTIQWSFVGSVEAGPTNGGSLDVTAEVTVL